MQLKDEAVGGGAGNVEGADRRDGADGDAGDGAGGDGRRAESLRRKRRQAVGGGAGNVKVLTGVMVPMETQVAVPEGTAGVPNL